MAAEPDVESLVTPAVASDDRDDVPSVSQFRICYQVMKKVTPPLGKTYTAECTRAREGGDASASVRRGGEHTAPKIAHSVAAALWEQDRQLLAQGKIVAAGIAQDARKGMELTKVRFVTKDFEVHTRMIGLVFSPHKAAVNKVQDLLKVVDEFCDGREDLKTLLQSKVWVATADGEAAEQLGLRLAKERVFKNMAAVLRCGLHMTQRTLETAVQSDDHCKNLVHQFITKASGGKDDPGSFTRAVRNSSRLKTLLGDSIAKTVAEVAGFFKDVLPSVALTGTPVMPSTAPQRFDSMLVALQRFIWNAPAILRFLCQEASSDSGTATWARELLRFLLHRDDQATPQNLLLLALLAEFVEVCSTFVRDQEGGVGGRFNIAKTASQLYALEATLADLFDTEEDGKPKLPRALSKNYLHGYVNVVRESMRLESSSMLVAAGKVAWYHVGDVASVKNWALAELGSILNIKKVFLAMLRSEVDHGVALAMQPFDATSWATSAKELRPTLRPLAIALGLNLEELCTQFESALPVALRLQQDVDDPGELWAKVMQDAGRRMSKLSALKKAVVFLRAAFPGTGEVENNFSIMQGMSSHRRAGVSSEVLRSSMKCVLDGPKSDDFAPRKMQKFEASLLCKTAQNWYYKMYGGRKYHTDRGEASWGSGRKGVQKEGSMAHELVARRVELRRNAPLEPLDPISAEVVKTSMISRWNGAQKKQMSKAAEKAVKTAAQVVTDAAPEDEVCRWSNSGGLPAWRWGTPWAPRWRILELHRLPTGTHETPSGGGGEGGGE